jgi:hypothetical protein
MFKMFLFIPLNIYLEHSLRRMVLLTNLDNTCNRMHNSIIKIDEVSLFEDFEILLLFYQHTTVQYNNYHFLIFLLGLIECDG